MAMDSFGFTTFETAFPSRILTNSDEPFCRFEKACRRTGVLQRHVADQETIASLASDALGKVLSATKDMYGHCTAMIFSSTCAEPDHVEMLQKIASEIAMRAHIDVVESVNFACSGFAAAVERALHLRSQHEHIAIVCSEVASRGLDYGKPDTFPLFGDGAAATTIARTGVHRILCASVENIADPDCSLGHETILCPDIDGTVAERTVFRMSGSDVLKKAVTNMSALLFEEALRLESPKLVVPHQASKVILQEIERTTRDRDGKYLVINRMQKTGNLVSASIPAALATFDSSDIVSGTHVICPTAGGGEALRNGWMSKGMVSFVW